LLKLYWERINGGRIRDNKQAFLATLRYRICYWRSAWLLFRQKAIQGYGLRSYRKLVYFAQAELNEKDPDFLDPERYITPQPRYVHNDWLEDLVELGIFGALIRWSLIGLIVYLGFSTVLATRDIAFLFVLIASLSVLFHSIFFFSLRMPTIGMVFWLLGGFIVLKSSLVSTIFLFSIPVPILALAVYLFGIFLWEGVGKDIVGSYYFMKFNTAPDVRDKERYCLKAARICPRETIYNTNMLIGYFHVATNDAYKYAQEMWFNYDGMTPGWVMYFNMGSISELMTPEEQAFRHYLTAYRMLPTFPPLRERLTYLEQFIPFPRKGEIMKRVREEARLQILLFQEKIEGLKKDIQNMELSMSNVVLQEAGRLNIPHGWQYNAAMGQFLSPDEVYQIQQQQAAQQQQPVQRPDEPQTTVSGIQGPGEKVVNLEERKESKN
jgi:hypothetical protein